jgi:CheY-like chemotaxis protein
MSDGISSPAKKWRILCIDDDPDLLFILQSVLATRHEVVTAGDGLAALSLLDTCDADFVICDVRMPGLDGFQTVEAIRRHPAFATTPVFFLTAETDREMAKRGFASGANLYLTKPFDTARLLKNIDYFLCESGQQPRPKRLALDAVEKAAAAPSAALQPSSVAGQGAANPRIIVLCASRPQLSRIHAALEGSCECVACAEPLASLQRLFRYEPDLLMINLAIPRLSGWGLAQLIRQNPRLQALPIILIEDEFQPLDARLAPAITREPLLAATASAEEIRAAVRAVTARPDFTVRAKQASFELLSREEEKRRLQAEEQEARQEKLEQARKDRFRRIQEFIDGQMR